ncbi:MAG TPA: tRNA pseudouridine(38-40) synthase TruA [Chthoniobacterales bacterium]|nr:tRNA pseudouridine(38-40) synthase TruA [Chthoniobacterales bacterium]
MSCRLKLIVAYDGRAFAGWQSQAHRNTVQDELEHSFQKIIGDRIRVHGAGRTDAGVHALAQCAHVDVPNRRISNLNWRNALNSVLPPTSRVLRCSYVSSKFHSRFSAKGKTYRYRIWTGPILPPLELHRAWHVSVPLNFDLFEATGQAFVGTHDFSGFAAKRGKKEEDTIRTIRSVRVRKRGFVVNIEIDGDGFLYKMVRLMVGAMVRVGLGQMNRSAVVNQLKLGRAGASRYAAPAGGLYLVRVWY